MKFRTIFFGLLTVASIATVYVACEETREAPGYVDENCNGCKDDPSKPLCDKATRTCYACTTNDECGTRDANKSICVTGAALTDNKCVQCTADTEAAKCAGNSCNMQTNECTQTALASLGFCQPCLADSECKTMLGDGSKLRCVTMEYKNSTHGTYCLVDKSTAPAQACPPRSPDPKETASLGGTSATYCFPQQNQTTCEAIIDYANGKVCATNSDCGSTNTDGDGLCKPINSTPNATSHCTYPCTNSSACSQFVVCHKSDSYCCLSDTDTDCK